ncbi:hypothetical protein BU24DRAFT_115922 [Aaosphaeria arxii CBS 175.79]|uniref:R3H-associated N-terminal domain-containing protein n=1 Tax=Aaosphaeria arxii CBS 175.79 TaxID=1450172 RepID=A0A6A5Y239_9PLEO|nr:uncharacterized protein BU24DRAFT_115922 [Aaosphaeria arxii CBS 175.79]KAF2019283.1 hypothetical protein BU24DRAFT_115922 [Aaosphaeria arxii CBS 175.79]
MAIHSTADDGPSPDHPQQAAPPHPIDIEAWTEQATAAMSAVTIAAPPGGESIQQTATVTLSIPLDDEHHDPAPRSTPAAAAPKTTATATAGDAGYYKRKEPLRRDSMKRRDALLKGKEGSRRRQRWENDHLLTNPHLTPPSPHDWEIHPTYPTTHVPYYLAPLWDAGLARQSAARRAAKSSKGTSRTVQTAPSAPGIVPRELRERLKKARGAKGLLRDLEGEVRAFVEVWEERGRAAERDGLPVDPDSSDDEIVFVGRGGKMREDEEVSREMKLFETPVSDQTGTFGRWLVHHIGTYYGLRTWSVTKGDPARREAYVGIVDGGKVRAKTGREVGGGTGCGLPRPLYGLV